MLPQLWSTYKRAISSLCWQNSREDAFKKGFQDCIRCEKGLKEREVSKQQIVWSKARYYWLACLDVKQQLLQFSAMIRCQTLSAETQQEQTTAILDREKELPWVTTKENNIGWEKTTTFQLFGWKSPSKPYHSLTLSISLLKKQLTIPGTNESCGIDKYCKELTELQGKQKSTFYEMERWIFWNDCFRHWHYHVFPSQSSHR